MKQQDEFLTPTEVAELLKIGRTTAYQMLATGEIPSVRVGRCIRVRKSELLDTLSKRDTQRRAAMARKPYWQY